MFSVLPLSSCLLCSPRAHVILHPQCSNIGLDGTPLFQNGLALRGSKVLVHLFYSLLALMQHVNEVDQSIHTTITFYLGMLSPHGSFFNLCWRSVPGRGFSTRSPKLLALQNLNMPGWGPFPLFQSGTLGRRERERTQTKAQVFAPSSCMHALRTG